MLTGFAGGLFVGRQSRELPPPIAAANPEPVPAAGTEVTIPEAAATSKPSEPKPSEPVPIVEPPIAPAVRTPDAAPTTPDPPAPVSDPRPPIAESGSLQFASRPAGARVFLDGALVGKTPMQLSDVRPGTHRVRFELQGHRPWMTAVDVDAGARVRVGASLEP